MPVMFTDCNYHYESPKMSADGSYTVSRKDEKTKALSWDFTFRNYHKQSGWSGQSERTVFMVEVDGHIEYTSCQLTSDTTVSIHCDVNNESKTGKASIKVSIWHNAGTNAGFIMGGDGYPAHNCTHRCPDYVWTSSDVSVPPYNPYTPPSYAIVKMNDNIGRVNTSNGYRIEYYIRRWYKYYIRL